VRENVQMALYSHAGKLKQLLARFGADLRREADALLDQVGMLDQAGRICGVLAYGDLKRVELAMALANQPRLLLMDEPTAGMAPRERVALMELTAGSRGRRRSPCCSPSTTWTWCSARPTASSCSIAAG
jgi:branched-chain amino acid transport system ATP-binding protein